jgi:hypothetical protein
MKQEAKKLFGTLTRAQQEVWATAIKGGCEPVIVDNKQKTRKVLYRITCSHSKCGRKALTFRSKKGVVFAVCSNKHVTRLSVPETPAEEEKF